MPSRFGLAVRAPRLLVIVFAAPAFEVGVALALLEPGARGGDGVEPVLAARDLGWDVQLGLVALGLVGRPRLVEQGLALGLQPGSALSMWP